MLTYFQVMTSCRLPTVLRDGLQDLTVDFHMTQHQEAAVEHRFG
jgi:hypothetical protein